MAKKHNKKLSSDKDLYVITSIDRGVELFRYEGTTYDNYIIMKQTSTNDVAKIPMDIFKKHLNTSIVKYKDYIKRYGAIGC